MLLEGKLVFVMQNDIKENDPRWLSILARKNLGVPTFIYAVKTTGIYCLVGCSSRVPLLQNIELFNLPEEAEKAGHRACKKCTPKDNWKSHTLKVLGLDN